MGRALNSDLASAIVAGLIYPVRMVSLQFSSQTVYVWSGPGTLTWDAMTFTGVGSLGTIGTISEGTDINAQGTTVTLSGIDPLLLSECLTDIQVGGTANVWFGLVTPNCQLIGTPYLQFSGIIDAPMITPGVDTISISLPLENRIVDMARPNQRRYTSADQRLYYPTDSAFGWVEQLNDAAWNWGS